MKFKILHHFFPKSEFPFWAFLHKGAPGNSHLKLDSQASFLLLFRNSKMPQNLWKVWIRISSFFLKEGVLVINCPVFAQNGFRKPQWNFPVSGSLHCSLMKKMCRESILTILSSSKLVSKATFSILAQVGSKSQSVKMATIVYTFITVAVTGERQIFPEWT